jgi:hypothetical protein
MSEQNQPWLPPRSVLGGLPQRQWSTQESARVEAALEVFAQLAAALTEQITAEQSLVEPDQARISALRAERASLAVAQQELRPADTAGVERVLRDLGPKAAAALRR